MKVPKLTAYGMLGNEASEVLQIDTAETWITPY